MWQKIKYILCSSKDVFESRKSLFLFPDNELDISMRFIVFGPHLYSNNPQKDVVLGVKQVHSAHVSNFYFMFGIGFHFEAGGSQNCLSSTSPKLFPQKALSILSPENTLTWCPAKNLGPSQPSHRPGVLFTVLPQQWLAPRPFCWRLQEERYILLNQ